MYNFSFILFELIKNVIKNFLVLFKILKHPNLICNLQIRLLLLWGSKTPRMKNKSNESNQHN